jgi:hypothetical protein
MALNGFSVENNQSSVEVKHAEAQGIIYIY